MTIWKLALMLLIVVAPSAIFGTIFYFYLKRKDKRDNKK